MASFNVYLGFISSEQLHITMNCWNTPVLYKKGCVSFVEWKYVLITWQMRVIWHGIIQPKLIKQWKQNSIARSLELLLQHNFLYMVVKCDTRSNSNLENFHSGFELPITTEWNYTKTSIPYAWWRHQMEAFSALLDHCAGNSPVTGEFPSQRPVTRSFDVFFDLCLG